MPKENNQNPFFIIRNLIISYGNDEVNPAVNEVNFELGKGDSLGIIGESGSGKTSIAKAIMGILPKSAFTNGDIIYKGKFINKLPESELNEIRWEKIALAFQNSNEVLNPVLSIASQISDVIMRHKRLKRKESDKEVAELLNQVDLPASVAHKFPHELSGGMRQKVLIAMAISCDPEILILDEPTSALDTLSKHEIITLVKKLKNKYKMTTITISHDLDVIKQLSTKLYVMYKGAVVEGGNTTDVLTVPRHTYTRGLLNSSPSINPYSDMWGIKPQKFQAPLNSCQFCPRCCQTIEVCTREKPKLKLYGNRFIACHRGGIQTVLKLEKIRKVYSTKQEMVLACNACDLHLKAGEIISLIGPSGSGKTTLASIACGFISPDQGKAYFEREEINSNSHSSIRRGIQMAFQDPTSAINQKFSVYDAICEPLTVIARREKTTLEYEKVSEKVIGLLEIFNLPISKSFLHQKCYTLSGGELQRVSLARALITEPKVLVADEICSMIDPSTQANILRELKQLQNQNGFSILYVTHDLDVARKISDRVYVMRDGQIINSGNVNELLSIDNAPSIF